MAVSRLARIRKSLRRKSSVERAELVGYISESGAEGSHNGIAAVLKTAARKGMQVRVLSPPPFLNRRSYPLPTLAG